MHSRTTKTSMLRSTAAALTLCGAALAAAPAGAETVRFGTPPWPGATVKTEVASQILSAIGYDTETVEASTAAILSGIAKKQIQADLALWRPSQSGLLDPAIADGEAMELAANIDGARYQSAVPRYVWDAGVRSLADLRDHAGRFDRALYGIEPGNVGNEIMKKAVKENTYGLDGWEVVPSSTTGMLAQVERAVSKEDWIVFQGWEPHWMNVKFDMKYLEDPEGIWGERTTVYTVVHPDFVDEQPNAARFLEQMVVPKEVQSAWILEYGYRDREAADVAREWIAANRETAAGWLEGVTALGDGRAAADVLAERVAASD